MDKVYISSPYRGNEAVNLEKARWYSRFAAEQGVIPVTPHIYFTQFLRDSVPEERDMAMRMNKQLLMECREIWVFQGYGTSPGMQQEIRWANEAGMPIRYFDERLVEVSNGGIKEKEDMVSVEEGKASWQYDQGAKIHNRQKHGCHI